MNLVVKMIFGAPLYGMATQTSDVDYKGVFLPSREEILLGRIPKSRRFSTGGEQTRNAPGDIDEEIYSLHYFVRLACEGQVVAMDMLHAPDNFWVAASATWNSIVAERQRFYSKRLRAFIDYARRQTAKYGIKGSRLAAAGRVLTLLKEQNADQRLAHLWQRLPQDEQCGERPPDRHGLRQYQVCGKIFQESVCIGQVIPVLEKFITTYGERARQAAANRNIDWKAVAHAMRAALQTREILTHGAIRYPLADAQFLKEIKAGRLDYPSVVAPTLEALVDEVSGLLEQSDLPPEPDTLYWERFICETLENQLFG